MTGDCHAPFCGSPGVRFPRATRRIKTWNANGQPFKWTKTADQIIDRICRYCSRISGPGH